MTRVEEEVLACEAQLRRAQVAADVEALDGLLDDELLFSGLDGALASKADDLAMHRSGRLRITRMEPLEIRLLTLGEGVVAASAKMDAAAVMEGATVEALLRYTRVWRKRDGRWRVAAGHLSAVTAPTPSAG